MTGCGHELQKLGPSASLIIKAEAANARNVCHFSSFISNGFSFYYYSRKVIIAAHICEMDGMRGN